LTQVKWCGSQCNTETPRLVFRPSHFAARKPQVVSPEGNGATRCLSQTPVQTKGRGFSVDPPPLRPIPYLLRSTAPVHCASVSVPNILALSGLNWTLDFRRPEVYFLVLWYKSNNFCPKHGQDEEDPRLSEAALVATPRAFLAQISSCLRGVCGTDIPLPKPRYEWQGLITECAPLGVVCEGN